MHQNARLKRPDCACRESLPKSWQASNNESLNIENESTALHRVSPVSHHRHRKFTDSRARQRSRVDPCRVHCVRCWGNRAMTRADRLLETPRFASIGTNHRFRFLVFSSQPREGWPTEVIALKWLCGTRSVIRLLRTTTLAASFRWFTHDGTLDLCGWVCKVDSDMASEPKILAAHVNHLTEALNLCRRVRLE